MNVRGGSTIFRALRIPKNYSAHYLHPKKDSPLKMYCQAVAFNARKNLIVKTVKKNLIHAKKHMGKAKE